MNDFKRSTPSEPSKPRVYLAGPMRGVPDFNFPAFDRVTRRLRALGWDVFSPADHDRKNGFDPSGMTGNENLAELGFDLRAALAADLDYITTFADAVAVLDGWDKSSGARAEVATAHALGLPVAYWGYFGPDGTMPDVIERIKSDTAPSGTIKANRIQPTHAQVVAGLSEIAKDIPRGHGKIWASAEVAEDLGFTGPEPSDCGAPLTVHAGVDALRFAAKRPTAHFPTTKPEPILTNEKWDACKAAVADASRFATADLNTGPFANNGEVRTTSSTGGQKGVKPECFSLLPVEALEHVARHYGIGAAKYDRNQWRKGYEWSKSYDAAMRHLTAFWRGEDIDAETGSRHLAAVAFHALTLLVFMDEQPDHDDRYRKEPS